MKNIVRMIITTVFASMILTTSVATFAGPTIQTSSTAQIHWSKGNLPE